MKFYYEDLVGIPFADGGRDKNGMDCWGLVKECFRRQGITVQDYDISAMERTRIDAEMSANADNEKDWEKIEVPVIGCLVLINMSCRGFANHVGIYVGEEKFIHAYASTGVCISSIRRWKAHIKGYYLPRG